MHGTLKDSNLKVRALRRARELREVLRFSLFLALFLFIAVRSTLFLPLGTIVLPKGRKKYARLYYLLPDNNTSSNFLVSIIYTQLFQQLF